MITQQEFVEDCYLEYSSKGLEPGNPQHGVWNKAHFPVPACLGGTEWVWLLREHHAKQGVLQSEEFQHPCIWSWEEKYLDGELLDLCKKWEAEKFKKVWESLTPEEKRDRAKHLWDNASENGKLSWSQSESEVLKRKKVVSQKVRDSRAQESPEKKRQRSLKRGKKLEVTTPDGRVLVFDMVKDAAEFLNLSENDLSAVCRGAQKTTRNHTARYL